MSKSAIGWTWVLGQAVLLGALILIPAGSAWPTDGAVGVIGSLLFFGGLIFIGVAALRLGSSLTPTPVPLEAGSLKTTGLYAYMRHPIYTGVLVTITGMAISSGSVLQVAITVITFIFFDRKAAWEEQQLRETYPDYGQYAANTPKFFPGA